ncbi:MAG: EthD family reductase [Hyphomicrobiales bacterium]|nr:EthD family reductase [Hyphomicrobiales bacterium]
MHKLLVLYNEPKDPAHFRKYYVEAHVPLASKLPGMKASRYTFDAKPLGPGKPPFCIFEAEFENEAALMAALQSNEGKAVAGDVPNYASGGVMMMHYAMR